MFKRFVTILMISASLTSMVEAAGPAPEIKRDPRIQHYRYSENQVYKLNLYLKSVTAVQFAANEEVQSILIGDSASWEVVKLKSGNVVSIKPTIPSAATNMTIYTNSRVYAFELRSLNEYQVGTGELPVFRSIFTYAAPTKAKANPVPRAERINSNYMVSGQAAFRPIWVQDNGKQTSFFLPENAPRPAILKVGAKGTEELINSRTLGSRVVVDGISEFWVLRIGEETVCIGKQEAIKPRPSLFGLATKQEVAHAR
ncbi:conjugal transfer protein [Ensifer sp. Root31]|uniref:TrbG/VirB9 family P-type conjugative transfer protein n=1 Tax=Ensifer sp. Root31 TaxID=1736512 RepID=UPI00070B90DF|nr:TrbG/VirB9 family P-type conjugative transfer protein [Ensifer sp. Root31]KQU85462.1 conjugal transfer protein [Ensifer sp. Root31]